VSTGPGILTAVRGGRKRLVVLAVREDATYTSTENELIRLGNERDAIVALMKTELYGAAFGGHPLNVHTAKALIAAAGGLLAQAAAIA
jgi:hypothetical protein